MKRLFTQLFAFCMALTAATAAYAEDAAKTYSWDYTSKIATSPDNGLYSVSGIVNDGSKNAGLAGMKLDSKGVVYFATEGESGVLQLSYGPRKVSKDMATTYQLTVSCASAEVTTKDIKSISEKYTIGTTSVAGLLGNASDGYKADSARLYVPAGVQGISIKRITGAEMVLTKIVFTPDTVGNIVSRTLPKANTGYASFSCGKAVKIPDGSDINIYTAKVQGGVVVLSKVTNADIANVIPANTGVLISLADNVVKDSVDFAACFVKADVEKDAEAIATAEKKFKEYDNELIAASQTATVPSTGTYYGLSAKAKQFVALSEGMTLSSDKAYIKAGDGETKVQSMPFDYVVTGINGVEAATTNTVRAVAEGIYTVQGMKVSEMTAPGLYIVNGKKVFKK